MKVFITQPHGKDKLVQAFKDAGAEIVKEVTSDTSLIIPTVDEELPTLSRMKDPRIVVNSPDVIDLCRDKAEFYRLCLRHGFAAPATLQDHFVLKPRFGKGGRGVQFIGRDYVLQERIPFPEYSVDYFADMKGVCRSLIQRQRLNVVNGESQQAKIEFNIPIYETVKRLGAELNLKGHNVIQGWYTGQTFILGEVNCRFGGGSHLTFDIFHSPRWLLDNFDKLHN